MGDSKYICTKPFTWLELGQNGECWICCEAWQEKPIGNDFITKLRIMSGFPIRVLKPIRLSFSFVVQQNNWKEMKDFVKMGREKYDVHVWFNKLINWGTFSEEELHQRQIHRPDHPEHKEFMEFIKDPVYLPLLSKGVAPFQRIFKQDKVKLGNLRYLLPSNIIPLL